MESDAQVILLDTHALIWLASDPSKLSTKSRSAIAAASSQGGIAICAITLWELAWLATHGRLQVAGTVEDFLHRITARTAIQPITPKIAVLANQFPSSYSSDPCDRLIGATALAEGISLITKDHAIRRSRQVRTI